MLICVLKGFYQHSRNELCWGGLKTYQWASVVILASYDDGHNQGEPWRQAKCHRVVVAKFLNLLF